MNYREKSHRLARIEYQGRVEVAFTACLRERTPKLNDVAIVGPIVQILATQTASKHCTVPVYCFMPDHTHLLIAGSQDESDAYAAMVAFKVQSGVWFARNRPDIKWQKDFYDHIVRKTEDAREQARYIVANPCRAGLAEHWHEWPYTGSIGHRIEDWLS